MTIVKRREGRWRWKEIDASESRYFLFNGRQLAQQMIYVDDMTDDGDVSLKAFLFQFDDKPGEYVIYSLAVPPVLTSIR